MLTKLSTIIFVLGLLLFGYRRILSYLRYFQQEEYSNRRFIAWLREKRAFDRRGSAVVCTLGIIALVLPGEWYGLVFSTLAATALWCIAVVIEQDPRTSGKLKLNMTQRARKISLVAFILYALVAFVPLALSCGSCGGCQNGLAMTAFFALLLVQSPALFLIASNKLLRPIEKALQDRYYAEAQRIMRQANPFVIGITGSYGKTGAKAALGDLMTQCLAPTFWPRKGINTIMGITRAIRETLKSFHHFAVIEMGAYNIGSIKRLCDFTPPKAALVTSVGIMHLERFGTPENVYLAKSEIAQALPADGILVCNGDSPNARRMASEHRRAVTLLYGLDQSAGGLDCYASELAFDDQGTRFVIHWKGARYPGRTPLLGRPALSNALGAFTMVCALGADPAYAAACLANLQPVDNRLVLDRKPFVSFLRDAYNSNPTGFEAALDVLKTLSAKRRIVMTPGMIELGEQQYEQNRRLATLSAAVADLFIIVGNTNKDALLAGLTGASFPIEKIVLAENREAAFAAITDRGAQGDLVLIENDLGDLHEGTVSF